MLVQYWHRVTNLPNESLAKKALMDNIDLKTNWIRTVEKLMNVFNLSESINNPNKLRYEAKKSIRSSFSEYWKTTINTNGRLEFYNKYKNSFEFEEYLRIASFDKRKAITKIRCSDHDLEIQRGRHNGNNRAVRMCKLCKNNAIDNEEHFLFECSFYQEIRGITDFCSTKQSLFSLDNSDRLGQYIMLAFCKRRGKELLDLLMTNFIVMCTEQTIF